MHRAGGICVGMLVCLVAVIAFADEPAAPGVARFSSLPMPLEVQGGRQPFVNLDVRLIELRGKVPAESKKIPLMPTSPRRGVRDNRILTVDQWAWIRETWKSEPDAKILAAARLRMKLGAKGEYRQGREIPVGEQIEKTDGKSSPVIRKEFSGTVIDATFTGVTADAIVVDLRIEHSAKQENGALDGRRISSQISLKEGETFLLAGSKTEQTTPASRLPFLRVRNPLGAKEELEEQGLIVLITPRLEDGDPE